MNEQDPRITTLRADLATIKAGLLNVHSLLVSGLAGEAREGVDSYIQYIDAALTATEDRAPLGMVNEADNPHA
jgi:hypothetical protein